MFLHAFALFVRVVRMRHSTASGHKLGTLWVCILLGGPLPEPCILRNIFLQRLPLFRWTRLAIRLLVFALYSSTSLGRLDLCATYGASMGESTCNDAVSNAKLLAAVASDINCFAANSAVDCCSAIWTCILILIRVLAFSPSEQLLVSLPAFFFSCFSSFCVLWTTISSCGLLHFCLLNFGAHRLQDPGNLFLGDLAASSLQPGVRSISCMLRVGACITLLSPVSFGFVPFGPK